MLFQGPRIDAKNLSFIGKGMLADVSFMVDAEGYLGRLRAVFCNDRRVPLDIDLGAEQDLFDRQSLSSASLMLWNWQLLDAANSCQIILTALRDHCGATLVKFDKSSKDFIDGFRAMTHAHPEKSTS